MTIEFTCVNCGARHLADERHEGRNIRCKQCGTELRVARPSAAQGSIPTEPETYAIAGTSEPDSTVDQWSGTLTPPSPSTYQAAQGSQRRRRRKGHRSDLPDIRGWLVLAGALLVGGMALLGFYFTAARGIILVCMFLFGVILALAGNLWIINLVCEEVVGTIWLYFLIPYYQTYHLFTRWREVWAPCSYL